MKKFIVLLLSVGFLVACKNDKNTKNDLNRSKDDYLSSDKSKKNDDKEKNTSDYSEDDKTNTGDDNKSVVKDNFEAEGWPQVERDSFISSCVKNAMKQGRSRAVSESYCDCMLNKMESLYPNINDAGRLTEKELDMVIGKYRDKCLEEY